MQNKHGKPSLEEVNMEHTEKAYEKVNQMSVAIQKEFIERFHQNHTLFALLKSLIIEKKLDQLRYVLKIISTVNNLDIDDIKNNEQQTLLHISCQQGCAEAVQILCSFRVSPNVRDAFRKTPIEFALKNTSPPDRLLILKYLIQYGADATQSLRDDYVDKDLVDYVHKLIEEKKSNRDCKIRNLIFQGKFKKNRKKPKTGTEGYEWL